jgi:hypothetical protein
MSSEETTESREFFYRERIARIVLICFVLYCAGWIVLVVVGVIGPRQTILSLLAVAIFPTSYCAWLIWLGRRYPIFSFSEQVVEWRQPGSRKRSSIPSANIIHAEKVTTHVVVLKTKSRGTIRIPLTGLSEEDRQEIKKLIESRFCE